MTYGFIGDPSHMTHMWLASMNDIWLHRWRFPHDTYMWLPSTNDIWLHRGPFPHDTCMWLASINDIWFYRGPFPHDTCMWLASINDIWLYRYKYLACKCKWHLCLSVTLPTCLPQTVGLQVWIAYCYIGQSSGYNNNIYNMIFILRG